MNKRRFLLLLVSLFLVGIVVLLGNTLALESRQKNFPAVAKVAVEQPAVVTRLARALQFKTITQQSNNPQSQVFLDFHNFLATSFPEVHKNLRRSVHAGYALLYEWTGTNNKLKPIIFMAHMDVVPVKKTNLKNWQEPPFAGNVTGGFIWGRGSIDTKSTLLGQLEAVEMLIKEGFVPERTIYFAYGHDEESLESSGAQAIADHLAERAVSAQYTLDEGMMIADKKLSPAGQTTAVIGIAEKQYLTLSVTASGGDGHSSAPPKDLAIFELSRALNQIENQPFPTKLTASTNLMFDYVGPEMPFFKKMVFANRSLFEPIILGILDGKKVTRAMIHNTIAPTMLKASIKENVLPNRAKAIINLRLLPGESHAQALGHLRQATKGTKTKVDYHGPLRLRNDPISRTDSKGFQAISKTVKEVFGNKTLVAPGLVIGSTDSRVYGQIARDRYRFTAIQISPVDVSRIHGDNERIAVKSYSNLIRFYRRLLLNSAKNKPI